MDSGGIPFRKVAVLGTGLMGGSLAGALKMLESPPVILGTTRNRKDRDLALERGWVDVFFDDNLPAAIDADLIVLAVPPAEVPAIWRELGGRLPSGPVVTDLSSVKGSLEDRYQSEFRALLPGYVSSHPMAGSEKCGMEAARSDLFYGKTVFLTPFDRFPPPSKESALDLLSGVWKALGVRSVPVVTARDHDGIVAHISHLPHVLSYALFHLVDQTEGQNIYSGFDWISQKGGSFTDMLRIARSSPHLWADILHENRAAVLSAIDGYGAELSLLRKSIATMGKSDLASLLLEWTASLSGTRPTGPDAGKVLPEDFQ